MQELRQKFKYTLDEILPYTSLKRSTFYYQAQRINRRKNKDEELLKLIKEVKSKHPCFGYRTVTLKLRSQGIKVNHKRVSRIMRENDLSAHMYNKQRRKYNSALGPQGKKAKNLLHRRFDTHLPFQKMVTDVSEFRYGNKTQEERVYLSPIKDLCTDEIVSYSISKHPTTDFVVKPLDALIKLRPKLNYRMTLHSDQGVQYQSVQWRKKLKENRIFQSMSRRATCLDNAPMESFFHTMKVELYHNKEYTTQEELVNAMISWISYYNNERIKVKLKGKTPVEYRHLALRNIV
ncbi:IS3 family transposase [Ligilactobacillus murinus]|nr:IS3 family transposase [Ligilactobacillus murinus]MCX4354389.1 IS3 family transposase [Lachnospiraceae bacterium]WET90565.1 IS3 family transposase [Ligilactobacillus murinus]WET90616.1 IS3 family transposase [Ligilactobacillus murinus]WET90621.1 IS3 family transposase [Ligilactobacillus murinus]WRY38873.1 IS3 family transposase [Ligilactobacillus murinus]